MQIQYLWIITIPVSYYAVSTKADSEVTHLVRFELPQDDAFRLLAYLNVDILFTFH